MLYRGNPGEWAHLIAWNWGKEGSEQEVLHEMGGALETRLKDINGFHPRAVWKVMDMNEGLEAEMAFTPWWEWQVSPFIQPEHGVCFI